MNPFLRVIFFGSLLALASGCAITKPQPSTESAKIEAATSTPDSLAIDQAQSERNVFLPEPLKLQPLSSTSPLCTDAASATDIGLKTLPVDDAYQHLVFLGELFTAARCGNDRLSEVWGVSGTRYTAGSSLLLKRAPQGAFLHTLTWIGFTCDSDIPDSECLRWELNTVVETERLLHLEPFADEIEIDDCRMCG